MGIFYCFFGYHLLPRSAWKSGETFGSPAEVRWVGLSPAALAAQVAEEGRKGGETRETQLGSALESNFFSPCSVAQSRSEFPDFKNSRVTPALCHLGSRLCSKLIPAGTQCCSVFPALFKSSSFM